MTKRVYVTYAQRAAARAIVKRNAARGIPTRPEIVKIANATRETPVDVRAAQRPRPAVDSASQTTEE
jgi:hypothetical protein